MKYHMTTEPDGIRIGLQERLDFNDQQEFRRLVSEVVERKPQHVTVDLSALEMLDSAGLGLLVILSERVKQAGGGVRLARPNQDVKHILDIVEFEKIIPIDAAA
jgi:HptB-dependent secretion and biofilm anti anti-sigma factor